MAYLAFQSSSSSSNGDVHILDGTSTIGKISNNSIVSNTTVIRPANVTPYTAKDVVGDNALITFTNFARENNNSGLIIQARLVTNQSTNISNFKLHLFHTQIPPVNDNDPYLIQFDNADYKVGEIVFMTMSNEDSTTASAGTDGSPNLFFKSAAASRNIYGVLQTLSAFTPISNQNFFIELSAYLD